MLSAMRSAITKLAVIALAGMGGAVGCAAPSDEAQPLPDVGSKATPTGSARGSSAGDGVSDASFGNERPMASPSPSVAVPEGAALTILCRSFTGPNHASEARQAKVFAAQAAKQSGDAGDFYVVHQEDRSVLYHGFYKTDDPARDEREARRLQADRDLIERMGTQNPGPEGGLVKAFPQSLVVPIDQPDPVAPAEYDLRNSDAFWTVAIAVYTDPALHKQAAVESVLAARQMGTEAYFLHKGNFSYVTIGAWPESAVRKGTGSKQANEAANAQSDYDPRPLVVAPAGRLPERLKGFTDDRGREAVELEVRLEVTDPSLGQTIAAYGYDVDGYEEGDAPLLVNVPESLGKAKPAREAAAPAKPVDVEALLVRPAGL